MTHHWASVAVLCTILAVACGDATEDEGDTGGAGKCDVHDGRDEFLACVCEAAEPCHGFGGAQQCESQIRGTLKYGQNQSGLECVQALGDLFSCEFELTCDELDELANYWNQCGEFGSDGRRQPHCRSETVAAGDACPSLGIPCDE